MAIAKREVVEQSLPAGDRGRGRLLSGHRTRTSLGDLIDRFRARYPFRLDPFQEEAIDALDRDRSVMVAAPTGTGKTVVAEFGIFRAATKRLRSIYTAPIKALSNQKFRDFRDEYGSDVGLLTGDIVENPQGRILVMTTEVLRNMLVQRPDVLDDVGCIVFDEIHYLADPERGTAWEESIILCPPHVQLVCLSATVSNAQEIADWISAVHRPIDLVFHGERTVPLGQYYFYRNGLHEVIDASGRQVADFHGVGGEARRRGQPFRRGRGGRSGGYPSRPAAGGRRGEPDAVAQSGRLVGVEPNEAREWASETGPIDVIRALKTAGWLPAIYFVFSRRDTERVAEELGALHLVDVATQETIVRLARERLGQLDPEDRRLTQVLSLERLLPLGVAYHHAGLLPLLKVLVEELFAAGLLPVVAATDTLALGVNMPAKTVVIGEMTKFDGESRRILTPNEYQQMTGRAGRRGLDERGHAVVPYSPWVPWNEAFGVATGTLHPVRSGFEIRYNTLLNLWDTLGEDQIVSLFSNSLREFQLDAHLQSLQAQLQQLDARIEAARRGRLIGEGDSFEMYELDRKALHAARKALKRAEERVQQVLRRIAETPFGLSRPEIKRRVRELQPGTPVFVRSGDWAVTIRPGPFPDGVIGLFLVGRGIVEPRSYGEILDIPAEAKRITVPPRLLDVIGSVDDVRPLLTPGEWSALRRRVSQARIPELEREWAEQRIAIEQAYAAELDAVQREAEDAVQRLTELEERVETSGWHRRPDRKQHEERLQALRELEAGRRFVVQELTKVREEKQHRTREIVENLLAVLRAFRYFRRGALTEKANVLKDIFDPNGLVLCEVLDRGLFDELSAPELVEVLSWFAYDRDLAFANSLDLPRRVWDFRRQLERLQQQVFRTESDYQVFLSKGASPHFFGVAYWWCKGWTFERILDSVNLTEGDLVLTLNKTLDLMRQVRQALRHSPQATKLVLRLQEGERLLRRGIVEQCFSALSPTGQVAPVDEDSLSEVPGPASPPRGSRRLRNRSEPHA